MSKFDGAGWAFWVTASFWVLLYIYYFGAYFD